MLPEENERKTKQDENLFSLDANNIGCFFPSIQYTFIGLSSPILASFGTYVSRDSSKNVSIIYFHFQRIRKYMWRLILLFTLIPYNLSLFSTSLVVIFTVISLALFFQEKRENSRVSHC